MIAKELFNLANLSFQNGSPWTEKQFEQDLAQEGAHYLIEEGKRGFIAYHSLFDEAEIHQVVVHPDFKGQGLGTKMLTDLVDILEHEGIKQIFLEVRESNQVAIGLYKKVGFIEISRRKKYYQHPVEDALILMKGLGNHDDFQ